MAIHDDIDHTGLTGIPDLAAHTGDSSDAHDASAISIADAGSYLDASDVEAAIQEIIAGFRTASIQFVIDGGGAEIADGIAGWLQVPFACTITACRLLADQSGAIVVDIWKDTYANYPPTNADSITSSATPEIAASGVKDEDTTLTGWTTSITAGDILMFNVDSCTAIERCTVALTVVRTI